MQAVGAEIVDLSVVLVKALFDKVELPDKLHEALLACRTIKVQKARKRQVQYIGKLMPERKNRVRE